MHICTNKVCSQRPPLYQTGFGKSQGWTHDVPPDQETVDAVIKQNPKLSILQIKEALTREVLKSKPPGKWGEGAEKLMLEHLGRFQPYWLSDELKKIWAAKYLKAYPPPEDKKK